MRSSIFNALFSLSILSFISGCAPKIQKVEDLAAIKKMFLEFRSAVRDNAGTDALPYISENSFARYGQFQDWANTESPSELAQRSVLEQIEVARLQQSFSESELKSMTHQEILAGLIDQDRLDAPFIKDATLGEPVFQERKCYLQIFDQSGPAKEKLTFLKEEDGWKIDLAALEVVHEKIYSGMMRKRKLSPQEAVIIITESWNTEEDSEPEPSSKEKTVSEDES